MKNKLIIPTAIIVFFGIGYSILNYTPLLSSTKKITGDTSYEIGGYSEDTILEDTLTQIPTNLEKISQEENIEPEAIQNNQETQINTLDQKKLEDVVTEDQPLRRILTAEEEAESTDGALALWYDNFDAYTVFETNILTSKNLPEGFNDNENYFDKPMINLKMNRSLPISVSKANGKYSYTPGYKTYKERVLIFADEVNVSFHNTMKSKIKEYIEKVKPRDQSNPDVQALVDKLDLLYKDVAISGEDIMNDTYTLPSDFCDGKQDTECKKDTELFEKYFKELKKAIFPKTPDEIEYDMTNLITENNEYIERVGSELGIDASDVFLANLYKAK